MYKRRKADRLAFKAALARAGSPMLSKPEALKAEWDEAQHPRDDRGRFAGSGGVDHERDDTGAFSPGGGGGERGMPGPGDLSHFRQSQSSNGVRTHTWDGTELAKIPDRLPLARRGEQDRGAFVKDGAANGGLRFEPPGGKQLRVIGSSVDPELFPVKGGEGKPWVANVSGYDTQSGGASQRVTIRDGDMFHQYLRAGYGPEKWVPEKVFNSEGEQKFTRFSDNRVTISKEQNDALESIWRAAGRNGEYAKMPNNAGFGGPVGYDHTIFEHGVAQPNGLTFEEAKSKAKG